MRKLSFLFKGIWVHHARSKFGKFPGLRKEEGKERKPSFFFFFFVCVSSRVFFALPLSRTCTRQSKASQLNIPTALKDAPTLAGSTRACPHCPIPPMHVVRMWCKISCRELHCKMATQSSALSFPVIVLNVTSRKRLASDKDGLKL